jgi:hypothetical protein
LLRQWRISNQLESNLQPLRVGVVEDFSGKTVGRVTVQEGDGIDHANRAILETGRYVRGTQGSRAAEIEAQPGGVVPSERAEIQVRSDRATGAGELVKFGQPVWYRFSFKIPGDSITGLNDGDRSLGSLLTLRWSGRDSNLWFLFEISNRSCWVQRPGMCARVAEWPLFSERD